MAKKTNPKRIPVTKADLDKARRIATQEAIEWCWALFFTVMRDKHGYGAVRLKRIWRDIENLSDSVTKGYVDLNDLKHTLKTEVGWGLK